MTTVLPTTEKDNRGGAAVGLDFDPTPSSTSKEAAPQEEQSERNGDSHLDVSTQAAPVDQQHLDEIDVVPIMTAPLHDDDERRSLLSAEDPKVVVVNNNIDKAPAAPPGNRDDAI